MSFAYSIGLGPIDLGTFPKRAMFDDVGVFGIFRANIKDRHAIPAPIRNTELGEDSQRTPSAAGMITAAIWLMVNGE